MVYFSPVLQGKRLKQHDVEMYKGMSKEITDYRESTGEQTLWTNSMFGGMPAWNISAPVKANLFYYIHRVLSLGLPNPVGNVFISMLGFFILLLILNVGVWTSAIGAIAYGFTSYMFIIIGAGHNTKAMAIAYMAPVLAGIILTYRGKYLWGSVLTAIALALQLRANHLQITYYLALIAIILVVAELIQSLRSKQAGNFFKASACLIIAGVFSVLTCFTTLYANYEFGKETTRGKPVLTEDQANQTKGLDRDYITQWSYGKGETWSLLIPNAKGGASAYIGNDNPALEKADRQFRQSIAQSNAYWGDQPGTSGPVYVGAIVVFLFILGALTVKGELKWVLLAATLLSILLSWGKNFMGFTDFFIDHVPGYNKFRAVSMTLVIAEVCMPLLGFLGLAEITKDPDSFKKNLKKFYIALGITAGVCLLFWIAPKTFFSFLSQGESQQFTQLAAGKEGIPALLRALRHPADVCIAGRKLHIPQPEIMECPGHGPLLMHRLHGIREEAAQVDMLRTDLLAETALVAGRNESCGPGAIPGKGSGPNGDIDLLMDPLRGLCLQPQDIAGLYAVVAGAAS